VADVTGYTTELIGQRQDGGTGSGRGVDILRVRDRKSAEKLTYVSM
jgi:hypothetical protein